MSSWNDLQHAASLGGTWHVIKSPIIFPVAGSLRVNSTTNLTLTLLGNVTACGGLCALNANRTGGHFVVSIGSTLVMDSLALVNSERGGPSSEKCLGSITRSDSPHELTTSGLCANGPNGLDYPITDWNDLLCGTLKCSSVVVAANASLHVSNCLFANNTGKSQQAYSATGAAISIVATSEDGFSITNTTFENNVVRNSFGSSSNSGGAIAVDQPFGAMVYPVLFTDSGWYEYDQFDGKQSFGMHVGRVG